ncbi:helix-turn-helix transcriptional regulator [Marinomonas primoryensis]|uniref:Helix-turn-helix (HTH) transcriptional regulator n=1 Tax=Marinomonas primoryensis TaxID=178399 RepID=A0A859CS82_9GAMM|nr:helix-turn-helix transcriptional regulator [Marinomonas primoryensis]QKK79043.1 helix-turn-helix (HTH) transcriptional regulator [Marinomonas primoryensis]
MKMKGQLDSAQPMKKHKAKSKKNELKKKKQAKLEAKKSAKEKKDVQPTEQPSAEVVTSPKTVKRTPKAPVESKQKAPLESSPQNTPINTTIVIEAEPAASLTQTNRQRASKSLAPMTKEEQLVTVNQIIKRLLLNKVSQGAALRELRVKVLGLRQEAFTELTGVSRKTLSEIENNKGNYTPEVINKVFKPFDLKVGLVPTSSPLLIAILAN